MSLQSEAHPTPNPHARILRPGKISGFIVRLPEGRRKKQFQHDVTLPASPKGYSEFCVEYDSGGNQKREGELTYEATAVVQAAEDNGLEENDWDGSRKQETDSEEVLEQS